MRIPWPASQNTQTPSQEIFSRIYSRNEWLFGSGEGSLPASTGAYRAFLQQFLHDYRIKSVVDAGCGDWQFSQLIDWTGIEYTGSDVVPDVIEKNQQTFAAPTIQFCCQDLLSEELPPADLLILKDVLQHLPFTAISRILSFAPHYRFVLVTNDAATANDDTIIGGYRALDLRLPPFSLPATEVLRYGGFSQVDGKPWEKVTLVIEKK